MLPILNMEMQQKDEREFCDDFREKLERLKDNSDAGRRMHYALDMTFLMLEKLHYCFTASEREARDEEHTRNNASSSVSPEDQFRINWSVFFHDIDVICNITHDFVTDKETGFVTAHKLRNVERHEMAETMIAHLQKTIHNLKHSKYQLTFERWLQDILNCWHHV